MQVNSSVDHTSCGVRFLLTLFLSVSGGTCLLGDGPVVVSGPMLTIPESSPDGSLHFFLASGGPSDAVGLAQETSQRLFVDSFESRDPRWQDAEGTTRVEGGHLIAADQRNVVVLNGSMERDVRVSVDASLDAEIGIVVHYQDPQNYALAFVTPAHHIVGYHEVVSGNFGPWIAPVPTGQLAGDDVRMTVEVRGSRMVTTVEDGEGHVLRTHCQLNRLVSAGAVGLYYDRSSAELQKFDNCQVERLTRQVPDEAIRVILPGAALDENAVWDMGSRLRVVGKWAEAAGSDGHRVLVVSRVGDITAESPRDQFLFPRQLPGKMFIRFPACGYSQASACGVVYRKDDVVTNGMPLGGIDTGCFDLETSGLLGYMTIFNTHVPRRGPVNTPLLGIRVGKETWVLCDPQPKDGGGGHQPSVTGRPAVLWRKDGYVQTTDLLTPVPMDLSLEGVRTADEIHYWGHYPVADLEFDTSAPVQVALRAWAPFLPGDVVRSMLPGAICEVHLANVSQESQQGTIALTFPGPLPLEAGSSQFQRERLDGAWCGLEVKAPLAEYTVGAIDEPTVRCGGELGGSGAAWNRISEELPAADALHAGASVAVDFKLEPQQKKVVRFILTWYSPTWNAGGYASAGADHQFRHMYARHYASAREAAEQLAANHEVLLRRVLAWQEEIYADERYPVWLRESLVNVLHLITETGLWAQAQPPLPDWVRPDDGLFGMNECPRGCPQIECTACSFYGNQPIVYFFPELALSTLRGYQAYQYPDGAPPWIFGGATCRTPPIEFARPARGYQFASNGISLAAMVDRYLLCYGQSDAEIARELYPALRRAAEWTVQLRKSSGYSIGQRVIAMPRGEDTDETLEPPTEWFEAPEPGWRGMTAHIGGLHLAQLRITERVAQQVGDVQFARQCAEWIAAGAQSMEEHLWTGRYYRNYLEPESGQVSDLIFGYQLDGEWITDHHGLPSALPADRVDIVLRTIREGNVAATRFGAVNYVAPDGTPAAVGGYGTYSYFPPEALMLAMTYMYNNQREFGLELAGRVWQNIVCTQGYTWDMPNIMRGDVDTGERTFGNDYYQDMMLWSMPAAVTGDDFGAPTRPGGLVDRVVRRARGQ